MTTHRTRLEAAAVHPSGWYPLTPDLEVTRLPLVDLEHELPGTDEHLFARLTYRDALLVAPRFGAVVVSPDELEAARAVGHVLRPWTTTTRQTDLATSEHHDAVVWSQLRGSWDGDRPVLGAGKQWARGAPMGRAWLMGWWVEELAHYSPTRRGPGWVQPRPSGQGPHDDLHHDYATTTMLVRPRGGGQGAPGGRGGASDGGAGASGQDGATTADGELSAWLAGLTLAERCCWVVGREYYDAPREIPGERHHERILGYSRHCRRGGRFLGVDSERRPLWDGGAPLPLPRDEDAWCAAFASAVMLDALQPGETPPHGLRVSVRELVEDARVTGRLRPAETQPLPGWLAIEARAGGDPLRGGTGHVRRVLLVGHDGYLGIGGNEGDTVTAAWHPLRSSALRAWIAVP